MSTAQILEEVKTFSLPELESLETLFAYATLAAGWNDCFTWEKQLLKSINAPMPQTERFVELQQKLQDQAFSKDERDKLIRIFDAREEANALRVEAVRELANLQGRPSAQLLAQTVGAPQVNW